VESAKTGIPIERGQLMHAAVLHALGKPPRFEEFPDPIPGEGEMLIHVSAATLKPVDKQMAAGTHYASPREFPVVCGMDGVGRLEDSTRAFFGGARRTVRRDGRTHRGSASSMFFGA
jgi:NADPH:quinone reductase-like Zn-dependent oxidoreductase